MKNIENYSLSKNLFVKKTEKGAYAFNKLFGNLSILSQREYEAINCNKISVLNESEKEELKERFFINDGKINEREILNKEIQYRREHLKTGYLISGLQLVLTNDCNFKCTYCFSDEKERLELKLEKSSCSSTMSKEIAFDAIEKILMILDKNSNDSLTIEFFGGEPLINWPVIESILFKYKDGKDYNKNIFYTITTNGSLLNNHIAEILKEFNVNVVLSYDMVGNKNRLTRNGNYAEPLIIRGLNKLYKYGISTNFNAVVSNDNYLDYDPKTLLQLANEYGVNSIALILDLCSYPYFKDDVMSIIKNKLIETCKIAKEYSIPITGYWHQIYEQIAGLRPINIEKGYKTCPAEGRKISVEPNGSLSNCKCVDKIIGHISDLEAFFKTEQYSMYCMKAFSTTPFCEGCAIEGFCSGLCMGSLALQYGNINALVPTTCKLYRDITLRVIEEELF